MLAYFPKKNPSHLFILGTSFLFFIGLSFFNNAHAQGNKILVEKFTGTWCGWCPNGDLIMDSLINNDPRFIVVDVHWNDALSITEGDVIIEEISNGSPSASFNRDKKSGFFNVGIPWSDWAGLIAEDDFGGLVPFGVNSETEFDEVSRELTITANANSLGILNGDYRINAYVVQEEFTAPVDDPAYYQVNFFNGEEGHPLGALGDPIVGMTYHNVVRAILGGAWGLEGVIPSPTQNQATYSTTFTYTVPEDWDENKLFVVTTVQKYNENSNKRDIINAAKEELDFSGTIVEPTDTTTVNPSDTTVTNPNDTTGVNPTDTTIVNPTDTTITGPEDSLAVNPNDSTETDSLSSSIADVQTLEAWSLYPNPASDFVFIEGNERIKLVEIWNINGQLERHIENPTSNALPVSDLQTGMYLMKVEGEVGLSWIRFVKN